MSSSVFYDCCAPYEYYSRTIKVKGYKNFGDIKAGDTLYMIVRDSNGYSFVELKVTNPWHIEKEKYYISCLKGKNGFYINFGSANCDNVIHDSKNSSIVFYNGYTIGTSKEVIYNYKNEKLLEEFKEIKEQYDMINKDIELLELLKNM